MINSLSVDEILHYLPLRTVQHVPDCLRTWFQECCSVPLSRISKDPGCDGGWKLLMLLPRMIMKPHPRVGRSGIKEIKGHQSHLSLIFGFSLAGADRVV